MIYTLLNKSGIVSSSWGGDVIPTRQRQGKGNIQTTVKGTATVKVQGRMSDTSEWIELDNSGALSDTTDTANVEIFPQMRAVVTDVGVAGADLATGGASTTPATGSISMSDNPSGAFSRPILISIPSEDSTLGSTYIDFFDDAGTYEEKWVKVTEGTGNETTFEFDATVEHDACSITFNASGTSVFVGNFITIRDIGGRRVDYYFVETAGDSRYGKSFNSPTEVLIGDGGDEAAYNLSAAIRADWLSGKIRIFSTYSTTTNVLTLAQADLKDTGDSSAADVTVHRGPGRQAPSLSASSWSGGTTGWVLDDMSFLPVSADTSFLPLPTYSGASAAAARNLQHAGVGLFIAFMNEKSKGTSLRTVIIKLYTMHTDPAEPEDFKEVTGPSNDDNCLVGLQGTHPGDPSVDIAIDENLSSTAQVDSPGVAGTNPVLLEINETSTVTGYTHIDRIDGESVAEILKRLVTALPDTTNWNGGKLEATNNFDNKSVKLTASGSIVDFGNSTVQIVRDNQNLITVSGMSGGATGVTVECQLDVAQSSTSSH